MDRRSFLRSSGAVCLAGLALVKTAAATEPVTPLHSALPRYPRKRAEFRVTCEWLANAPKTYGSLEELCADLKHADILPADTKILATSIDHVHGYASVLFASEELRYDAIPAGNPFCAFVLDPSFAPRSSADWRIA